MRHGWSAFIGRGGVMKQLWAYLWGIGLCVGGVASAQLPQIDNYSGDANAFAHDWQTQFMNTGLGPNPVLFTTILNWFAPDQHGRTRRLSSIMLPPMGSRIFGRRRPRTSWTLPERCWRPALRWMQQARRMEEPAQRWVWQRPAITRRKPACSWSCWTHY